MQGNVDIFQIRKFCFLNMTHLYNLISKRIWLHTSDNISNIYQIRWFCALSSTIWHVFSTCPSMDFELHFLNAFCLYISQYQNGYDFNTFDNIFSIYFALWVQRFWQIFSSLTSLMEFVLHFVSRGRSE